MSSVQIIISGFGGQGILSSGRLIAYAGMLEGKHVSWLPSYGPEMRGGTANCQVIISDEEIASPMIGTATHLVAMNLPSLDKFEEHILSEGVIISDSTLVSNKTKRNDIREYRIPATKIASDYGNKTFAVIILLGKLLSDINFISKETFKKALYEILPKKKHYLIEDEMKFLEIGEEYN